MSCTVRPYEAQDRGAVRHICCESGFMGEPVDPLFGDRELFADFFTAYYTDCEPEHCLVAEADGRVVGYLICCADHARYPRWQAGLVLRSVPRVCGRILTGRYRPQDLRFLGWFLLRAHSETPAAPAKAAHFHFNVLREWRNGSVIRRLFFTFLDRLDTLGAERVYGQIQVYENRRPLKIFERYGFECYAMRKVTKFKRFGAPEVSVATMVRAVAHE